jgi:hypothetical protein
MGTAVTTGSIAVSALRAAFPTIGLGDPITIGSIIIAILSTILLPVIIILLQVWLSKKKKRIIKITSKTGDKTVEVEYDPNSNDPEALSKLIATLADASESKKGD